MPEPPRRRIRALRSRARNETAWRLRRWLGDPMCLYAGDPRRRIEADDTSMAPIRLLQFDGDDGPPVRVGRYCALSATAAVFHGGLHNLDWVGVMNGRWVDGKVVGNAAGAPVGRGQVVIGSDVYVGYEALIMSGVTLGDGAVVSARAWVTRDVEPYEIVAGNPARRVGWRFDEVTRAALLQLRWWDWPVDVVMARMDEINSPDVEGFLRRYGSASVPPGEAG